ncbi:protein phosphatase CheZ [Xylophilus sp.]|uniref:protein phosphatase CheZ n=1 Tax=Xylophilus sp. TaxID=2653893 RepID=UPI0013BCBC18|nr:protein phosphatase CheZ [Xylophilus sp.]KAF1047619.1 MAG: Protein phosphatase CheZ [Xylophilus sp.]
MTASPTVTPADAAAPAPAETEAVHVKIGTLTRQLHDALNELGYADKLRGTVGELPDAKSRLSYIARLTGEAAEKVLGRVEQAKAQQDYIATESRRVLASLIKDPVAAVARGEILNFLVDVERVSKEADTHLTEIMMAQDFHDLTGQVIARVVNLAATIEEQLVQLLIQTAPPHAQPAVQQVVEQQQPALAGPVVDPENTADVVTSQSQVDDLLASLGF